MFLMEQKCMKLLNNRLINSLKYTDYTRQDFKWISQGQFYVWTDTNKKSQNPIT